MAKDWTKETIPASVVTTALDWGKNFVTKTNWMTAHETMGEFSFGDKDVFVNVRNICRILFNYNTLGMIIIGMLQAKHADEHDINVVWDILSKYADPIDIQKWHGKKV